MRDPAIDNLHFHGGSTCHGFPTLDACVESARLHGNEGKVLERATNDVQNACSPHCYSLKRSHFTHWAKFGRFVAELRLEMRVTSLVPTTEERAST